MQAAPRRSKWTKVGGGHQVRCEAADRGNLFEGDAMTKLANWSALLSAPLVVAVLLPATLA
jgi:hypothetical protein